MEDTYTAPSVVELGSVAELTQTLNTGGHLDSNFAGVVAANILS